MPVRQKSHSIDSVFTILLFGIFVLMLLFLLLFSAQMYRTAVRNLDENQNLHTAMTYVSTKFRQHDAPEQISVTTLEELPALTFTDTIEGTVYNTFIYLQDGELRELFSPEGAVLPANIGTPLAELESFSVTQDENGFYEISMTDQNGISSRFVMHPGGSL